MPGPPSQKGKFKPKKPAKKVRVVGTPILPDAAPSSAASAPAPAAAAARGQRGSRGGGGREGGRGRGRGRGRRAPLPQGQVFFTASLPESKKSSKGAAKAKKSDNKDTVGSSSKTSLLKERKDTEASEEVVGTLDRGIGSQLGKEGKKSVLETYDSGDYIGQSKFDNEEEGVNSHFFGEGFTYDSDSSLEEAKPRPRSSNIPPTRLPFPVAPLPNGVGAKKDEPRPYLYDDQQPRTSQAAAEPDKPLVATPQDAIEDDKARPSPFVDTGDAKALQAEMDSLFLFQFPTRLPSLVQQVGVSKGDKNDGNNSNSNADGNNDATMEEAEEAKANEQQQQQPTAGPLPIQTSEVVTAPVKPGSFDNILSGAVPGRLGKLLVYKSGKTVLVFQGPDGSPEIRMNVSEGLSCSFEQQAVLIDHEHDRYIKLGQVHKTAVVTPDLDEAFSKE